MIDKKKDEVAKSCVNILTIEGYLTSEVVFTFCDAKKTHKATFFLKNPIRVGKKVFFNEIYVVVYGKKARECYQFLSLGDYCTVTGKMCMWQESGAEYGVCVNASDVFWNKK